MLFNSLPFLFIFLPITLAMAVRLRGLGLLRWLSLASLVFYAFAGHAWFLLPMGVTIVLDFWVAQKIFWARGNHRLAWLCLSLCGNLGMLCYFKYGGLWAHTADAFSRYLWRSAELRPLPALFFRGVLPAGISFYTFQTLSYVIDVYRGTARPEKNFAAFVSFVTFFPHLVAGPLTRHNQLLPALRQVSETGIKPRWKAGTFLFAIGLCKKVLIADRIAGLVDPLLATPQNLALLGGWISLLGYTLQIYFDFSGYTDMALGLGRLFDIELPQNFDSPYQASSPVEFWQRWHMTLSLWLRDYLYIPLGGNRRGHLRRDFNLMATMVLGGLWHGASWTFAAWGFYHGVLLVLWHRVGSSWKRCPVWVQRCGTFLLMSLGWVPFRSRSFAMAREWLASLAGLHGLDKSGIEGLVSPALLLMIAALAIVQFAPKASHWEDWEQVGAVPQILLAASCSAAILLMNFSSRFLYFQF